MMYFFFSGKKNTYQNTIMSLEVIVDYLRIIIKNQEKPPKFSFSATFIVFIITALGFVVGTALNNAFTLTFALIPTGGGLLGAWIQVIILLPLIIGIMYLLIIYLQPSMAKKMG